MNKEKEASVEVSKKSDPQEKAGNQKQGILPTQQEFLKAASKDQVNSASSLTVGQEAGVLPKINL